MVLKIQDHDETEEIFRIPPPKKQHHHPNWQSLGDLGILPGGFRSESVPQSVCSTPPCCAFAHHLVGKIWENGHLLLMCSSQSAQSSHVSFSNHHFLNIPPLAQVNSSDLFVVRFPFLFAPHLQEVPPPFPQPPPPGAYDWSYDRTQKNAAMGSNSTSRLKVEPAIFPKICSSNGIISPRPQRIGVQKMKTNHLKPPLSQEGSPHFYSFHLLHLCNMVHWQISLKGFFGPTACGGCHGSGQLINQLPFTRVILDSASCFIRCFFSF